MTRWFASSTTLALLPCALAAAAHAQPAAAQAEALFRQGRVLLDAGKVAEACDTFAESQRLDPRTTTLLNLAGCREQNGQLATAWGMFLDAMAQTRGAADAASKQLHGIATKRAQALEARVSTLTIRVPADRRVAGLVVTRGGEPVATPSWDQALPIDGGTYVVEASAPGRTPWRGEVVVAAEKDAASIEVPALPELPVDPGPAQDPPPGGTATGEPVDGPGTAAGPDAGAAPVDAPRTPGPAAGGPGPARFIAAGGAVVLLGAAVGLEMLGRSLYADAKAETSDLDRRADLYDAANLRHRLAIGSAVVGVGAAAVATWLFLRSDGGEARAASATLVPTVVGDGAAVTLLGRF
jgi:hypothetical protein